MEFFSENDDIINSLDTEKGFYLTGRESFQFIPDENRRKQFLENNPSHGEQMAILTNMFFTPSSKFIHLNEKNLISFSFFDASENIFFLNYLVSNERVNEIVKKYSDILVDCDLKKIPNVNEFLN